MKTRILCLFFLIINALFLFGCGDGNVEQTTYFFEPEQTYIVGISGGGMETKGKLWLDAEEKIHFLHERPDSALFGMEEIVDENSVTVKFQDISWTSNEVYLPITKIFTAIQRIKKDDIKEKYEDTMDGTLVEISSFGIPNEQILLYRSKQNHSPLKIIGSFQGEVITITFSQENV